MIALWLLSATAGAVPDRVATSLSIGSQVVDVVSSADQSTVAFLSGAGTVSLMDLGTWDLRAVSPCSGVGGIARAPGVPDRFWAGCDDGSIQWFELGSEGPKVGTDGPELAEGALLGLTANDTLVFGLADNPVGEGNPQVHAYNVESDTVLTGGYPSTLSYGSVEDMEANNSFVLLSHGGATFTKVTSGGGGATRQQGAPGASKTSDIETVGASRVFVAGGGSGVLEFQTGSNLLSLFLTDAGGVSSASAIAANEDDEWFAIADDEAEKVILVDLDAASGTPSADVLESIDVPSADDPLREFAVIDGYLFGGTDGGEVHIFTNRPWVNAGAATPTAALNGDRVSVSFTADQSGTWEARLGASSNGGGTRIAEGTAIADEESIASFEIDDAFKEGDNVIRLVVENEAGAKGHDSATVSVDNPPTRVSLSSSDVGFGDQRIEVHLNGISDEDLSHYVVFVSAVPFTADDYPAEGPPFAGVEGDRTGAELKLPRRVEAAPGKDKTISIDSLTNGATYYLAVRAYDQAGQESAMSNVVNETPRETFGASDLVNEKGGHSCNTVGASSVGLLALLGGLLAGARRSVVAAVVVTASVVGQPAFADTDSEWPQKGQTFSDFVGRTFEARYGDQTFDDPVMDQVFGDSHRIFWLEYGMTLFELTEFTVASGLYKDPGHRVDAAGNSSADDDTMQAIPFSVDATFRLDVLPEQPIVPFAGFGYDYWLWEESWTGGEKSGGKSGTHTSMGVNVLLDIFQPGRASRLEASSGITDSYISIEWRKQSIGTSGLSFSGEAVMIGLKLDH